MKDSLTKKVIDGGVWSVALSVISFASQVASVVILARIFDAEDFGMVALAIMILNFFKSVTYPFIVRAIILKDELSKSFIGSSRLVSLFHGVISIIILFLFRSVLEGFFDRSGISDSVFYYVIFGIALTCIYMPIKAMLEKELRIKEIQKAEILIAVGAIIVQIIIAMAYDWGYISLEQPGIILFTSLVLVQVARTLFFVSKSRFVVNFSWMDIKSIYKKSAEVVTGDLANVFATEGDNMIISRYMELASLGIYSNAYKLMKMPTKLLSNVFNQIAFPAFAILDQERLKLVYVKLIYLISYVLFPLIAVILLFYKEIVLIILGPQWEAVELPFLILAVGIYLRLVYKVPTTVLKARDKFRTLMTGQIIYALLIVLLAFAFKSQGVPGVAFATVLALFLYNVFLVIVMRKEFPLKLSDYIRVLTRPAFMFIGSFAVLYASKLGLEQMMNNNTLVFAISLGFYLLLIGLLFKKKREFLLGEDGMWWYSTLRKKDKK